MRTEQDTIARERVQRIITPRQFALMNAELTAQLEESERRMSIDTSSSVLHSFLGAGATSEQWDALGVDRQRLLIGAAMTIRLHSGGRGVRNPPPESIEIEWRKR